MSDPTSGTVTVGRYLAERLVQLKVTHLFGLPGDFNLNLLDEMLEAHGLEWVGSSNELNAAYAADGYARVGRHPGALVTTYGVGELSAINGVAGSFAEDIPMIHIVGLPSRSSMAAGAALHHTFLDGDFGHFVRAVEGFTVVQAILADADPGGQIDDALEQAVRLSKPAYIGVPLDLARHLIPREPLDVPLPVPSSDPQALSAFRAALRDRFALESSVTLLVGPGVHRMGLESEVARLADLPGVLIATQPGSKAIIDESHPASLGTYLGGVTASVQTRAHVDEAPLLIMLSAVMADFTTGFFTHEFVPHDAVELSFASARIGDTVYPGIRLSDSLSAVAACTRAAGFNSIPEVSPAAPLTGTSRSRDETDETDANQPLDHERFWAQVQDWLPASATVVAEAGTAFYGALDLHLPRDSDLLGQPVWSSIGFTIPATLGAALARPDRRPVLFIGDGAAQLTIQELGPLFARRIPAVIFLLNNDGYTVERMIQSPHAAYQDIVPWEWASIPAALGGADVSVHRVETGSELREALRVATSDPRGSFFIEVILPQDDAPRLLITLAAGISATNKA